DLHSGGERFQVKRLSRGRAQGRRHVGSDDGALFRARGEGEHCDEPDSAFHFFSFCDALPRHGFDLLASTFPVRPWRVFRLFENHFAIAPPIPSPASSSAYEIARATAIIRMKTPPRFQPRERMK